MDFLFGFLILLVCQILGEVCVILFELPVSGAVVGLLILLFALIVKGCVPESLSSASSTLIGNFSLLFIPAGAGIMLHYKLLMQEWFPISITLLLSTIISLVATATIMYFSSKFLTKTKSGKS